jgi:hypothetical protein
MSIPTSKKKRLCMSLKKLTSITPAVFPFWKSKKFFRNMTSHLLQLIKEFLNSLPNKKKKSKRLTGSQNKNKKKFTTVLQGSSKSSRKTK